MNSKINNLSVFTEGSKENKAIIFVHGFPFDNRMWDAQVEYFCSNYFCVRYDIRGLGKSTAGTGQFTMEMFVDDLEQIVDELKLDKPVLCGLSMGGYISLRAMERMQNKFSKLILCDTKSVADDNETKLKRADAVKKINEGGIDLFIEEFIRNCFGDKFVESHPDEYIAVVNRSKLNNPVGVKGCLLAMAGRTDTTETLKDFKIPTLIICGSEDKLSPPDLMKSMADEIPDSEFVLIEGAGHMTPIENPALVNDKMNEFLKK